MLGIIPLAGLLGDVTEQIALYTNETMGGLLNASFGNVTEIIICIIALSSDLYRIIQVSLLGSVLSNMLLVLGCSFVLGGVRYKEQTINTTTASANISAYHEGVGVSQLVCCTVDMGCPFSPVYVFVLCEQLACVTQPCSFWERLRSPS
jgi:calcium/proton exchanger cax